MIKQIITIAVNLLWQRLYKRWQQFFKYCLGGGMAFILDIGGLYIFTEFFHIWYLLSATLSFILAAVANYLFQRFITFKSESKKIGWQFLSFVLIAIVGLGINNTILYLLVEFGGMWYILAKALAAVVVLIWNFIANKRITFRYI